MSDRRVTHGLAALAGAIVAGVGAWGATTAAQTPSLPAVTINPGAETRAADRGGAKPAGLPSGVSSCGVERAAVKHLTDGATFPTEPTVMTIDQLVNMAAPPVTPDSSRFPVENTLVELRNVHVIAAKQEADSDLHIILATDTGAEMNVEAPAAACDSSGPYAGELAAARAAIDAAMPNVSSQGYTPLDLRATVEGVLFFDVLHGQRGAPNGVELHPVTWFSTSGQEPPPFVSGNPPPTTGTFTTATTGTDTATTDTFATDTTATTTENPADPGPGCSHWPGRHFFHHVWHHRCRKHWFTTP